MVETGAREAFLKTTSWEIHKEGFKGGASKAATLASEIYFILISLNMTFTNAIAAAEEMIYDAKSYGRYCIKLIDEYRQYLYNYYGEDSVNEYITRYTHKRD
jgi:hypothetical protein